MRVGVIGAGFVGSALLNALKDCQVLVCDPQKSDLCIEDMVEARPDLIFICVPTPSAPDGSVDAAIVREVVGKIPPDLLIVVKSTVTPDHLLALGEGRRLVYNPEFLTQRSANRDFIKPDSLIFGGGIEDCRFVQKFYRDNTKVHNCPVFITDIATASLVKYTLNCWFAIKVSFLNEIYRLHQQVAGTTWEEFASILAGDSRVGPTHLQVPGPDGQFGWGGACFPKDTAALLMFAAKQGLSLPTLKQAVLSNRNFRE